jgi:hypothetical protein
MLRIYEGDVTELLPDTDVLTLSCCPEEELSVIATNLYMLRRHPGVNLGKALGI